MLLLLLQLLNELHGTNAVTTNENILCSNYDEMTIVSGNWVFNNTGNNSCTLEHISVDSDGDGYSKIWFGSELGRDYDENYSAYSFVFEAKLSVEN